MALLAQKVLQKVARNGRERLEIGLPSKQIIVFIYLSDPLLFDCLGPPCLWTIEISTMGACIRNSSNGNSHLVFKLVAQILLTHIVRALRAPPCLLRLPRKM